MAGLQFRRDVARSPAVPSTRCRISVPARIPLPVGGAMTPKSHAIAVGD